MRLRFLPLLLSLLSFALPVQAEEKLLPVSQQVLLLLKALTYERTLMRSDATVLQIGFVYDPAVESSRRQFDEFEREFRPYTDKTLRGHAVSLVPVPLASFPDGRRPAVPADLSIVYVPALDPLLVPRIRDWTRDRKILSATPIEAYVEAGLSLGLVVRNGRTGVTVNRTASSAEGMAWAEDFLHLCRVID